MAPKELESLLEQWRPTQEVQIAVVRATPDDSTLTISLTLAGQQRNMRRYTIDRIPSGSGEAVGPLTTCNVNLHTSNSLLLARDKQEPLEKTLNRIHANLVPKSEPP